LRMTRTATGAASSSPCWKACTARGWKRRAGTRSSSCAMSRERRTWKAYSNSAMRVELSGYGCRRAAIFVLGLATSLAAPIAAASTDTLWTDFRTRFIADDGRVVDTGSGGVSHSEGQGWSMLFAEANDD